MFFFGEGHAKPTSPSRKANVQATDWTVQDLNLDPKLPYGDAEFLGMLEG